MSSKSKRTSLPQKRTVGNASASSSPPASSGPSKHNRTAAKRKQPESSTTESVARPDKRVRYYSKTWDERLEELKQFKADYGHCHVPMSFASLYDWLKKQRNYYLNPNSKGLLKDAPERERRTKELKSVLGTDLQDFQQDIRMAASTKNKWNDRLEELKEFKATNGHCRVPQSHGSLLYWINNQRNVAFNPNSPGYMKNEKERERRRKELESVLGTDIESWRKTRGRKKKGVKTDAVVPVEKKAHDAGTKTWDERLEELKKFKAENGNCIVPRSQGPLYGWLNNQRNKFLNPNSPKYLQDVKERERRNKELNSVLGANLRNTTRKAIICSPRSKWDERLEELKRFKADSGHCRVPSSQHGSLYDWLNNQCLKYLNPNSPKYLQHVPERERRQKELESVLGTNLEGWRNNHATNVKTWDERLEDLKQFKADNGHCFVTRSLKPLYNWLENQRHKYFNPKSLLFLKDAAERERRQKVLESVLGTNLESWRKPRDAIKRADVTAGN